MIRLPSIALIAVILSACDNAPRELVLVRPESAVDSEIVTNLVGLIDRKSAVEIVLTDKAMTGGDALRALAEGRADLALISNDQPFRDDIAAVLPVYATVLHIVHPAERTAGSFAEMLSGAKVFAGLEGSASRRVFERLTANIDLGGNSYAYITDRATDVDLAILFAPISPQRLAEFPGVRLWSMGPVEDVGRGGLVDSAVLLNPHFRPFVIPAGTYGAATTEPIATIAVDKLIVSRKDIDSSVIYDLINEIQRLRPALATVHPGLFQQAAGDFDVSRSRFVLHAGTQDYLQRSEPTFIERYSGVAEVLVTLMIAAFSASLAGIRIYNRRRKNRIDRFYARAMNIRKSVSESATGPERSAATTEIRKLQDEAFELLVTEKLAADESFRIFITLSNDVLEQINRNTEN